MKAKKATTRQKWSEADMIDRAFKRYVDDGKKRGENRDQPNPAMSEVVNGRVVLSNVNGTLIEYKISPTGRLMEIAED